MPQLKNTDLFFSPLPFQLPGSALGDGDTEMNETQALHSRTPRSSESSTRPQVIRTVLRSPSEVCTGTNGVWERNHLTASGGARGRGSWRLS